MNVLRVLRPVVRALRPVVHAWQRFFHSAAGAVECKS